MTLSTLLCGFGIALAPAPEGAAAVEARFQDELALVVDYGQTHLMARSLAKAPLLLFFKEDRMGTENAFWLPPGAIYVEDFARGTLDGLSLEVVSTLNGSWRSSGALALEAPARRTDKSLWVLASGQALTRTSEGAPLAAATPAGSALPSQVLDLGTTIGASAGGPGPYGALHVPVPSPSEKPKPNKPPKLGKKPLPPV